MCGRIPGSAKVGFVSRKSHRWTRMNTDKVNLCLSVSICGPSRLRQGATARPVRFRQGPTRPVLSSHGWSNLLFGWATQIRACRADLSRQSPATAEALANAGSLKLWNRFSTGQPHRGLAARLCKVALSQAQSNRFGGPVSLRVRIKSAQTAYRSPAKTGPSIIICLETLEMPPCASKYRSEKPRYAVICRFLPPNAGIFLSDGQAPECRGHVHAVHTTLDCSAAGLVRVGHTQSKWCLNGWRWLGQKLPLAKVKTSCLHRAE
jgi:hypothetical protein